MSQQIDKSPLVSVILPCKDAARFVQAAVDSVLAQTHRELKLIVVDDDSDDETVSIVQTAAQSDPRLTLITLAANSGGPAKPRNVGLSHASGEFIAFIDADDVWMPNKLAVQLATMNDYSIDFCSTLHRHFKEDDALIKEQNLAQNHSSDGRQEKVPKISFIDHQMMLRKNRIVTSSVVLRSDLLEYVHFSEETQFVAIEDYLAWLKLLQRSNIVSAIIQTPLVYYRTRSDSISSSKLEMASKIFNMLSAYEVQGKRLGLARYYYYFTYLIGGLKSVFSGWLNRISG